MSNIYSTSGDDTMVGSSGNDTYYFSEGFGTDTIYASGGIDTLNFSAVTQDLMVDLSTGLAKTWKIGPDEFQVNTFTDFDQYQPVMTTMADGGFMVVWSSSCQDSDGSYGIYGQRYAANGRAQGPEFRVNTTIVGTQAVPSITKLSDGSLVVAWTSYPQVNGIFAQRYDANGEMLGSEFRINQVESAFDALPSLAALADGGFIAIWASYEQDGSGMGVYGLRFDANGQAVGSQFQVNNFWTFNQSNPSVTSLANGGFVVTWDSNYEYPNIGVYGRCYDANGLAQGDEFQINAYAAYPTVQGLADGSFVVLWQDSHEDANILGQRYDAHGVPQGPEFQVNTISGMGVQFKASAALLENGGFVVSWTRYDHLDINNCGVFARIFNPDGTAKGDEFRVNSYITYDGFDTAVTSLADGGFVITWPSYFQDGSGQGIYGQRFDSEGNPIALVVDSVEVPANTMANAVGGSGNDRILGNNLSNRLDGGAGADTLSGGDGNDTFIGGAGNDNLDGGTGEDWYKFYDNWGQDTITGDAGGFDHIDFYNVTTNLVVDLRVANGVKVTSGSNTLSWDGDLIEQVTGGWGNDLLYGNDLNNTLEGYGGMDTLFGGGGNDRIVSGIDDDQMDGGLGDDRYIFSNLSGHDLITGDAGGTDIVEIISSNNFTINLNSGAGHEVTNANGTATVNWDNDVIEYATAGSGNDTLIGNSANNKLTGGAGNDSLHGGAGNDSLYGGTGNDRLEGNTGSDRLEGGSGDDVYVFAKGDGQDTVVDASGTADKLLFDSSVSQSVVAIFKTVSGELQIGYTDSSGDLIKIQNFDSTGAIEQLELSSGNYLTDANVNQIIADMAAYASANSISFNSLDDVKNDAGLMAIVNSGWHS